MRDVRDPITELRARIVAERKRRDTDVLNTVLEGGVRCGDFDRFNEGVSQLDLVYSGWRRAMRGIARLNANPPYPFRQRAVWLWVSRGDIIREEAGDDLTLIAVLRKLLPIYQGPGMRLWRGDAAWNRRRRTYGPSWSRDVEIADGFARGQWRMSKGGSVLLETDAPPEAVIYVVPDDYGEEEVLVDRRRLTAVRVIARYEQISYEEYREQMLVNS